MVCKLSHKCAKFHNYKLAGDLNLYCIKGALALFVLVSFSGYVC